MELPILAFKFHTLEGPTMKLQKGIFLSLFPRKRRATDGIVNIHSYGSKQAKGSVEGCHVSRKLSSRGFNRKIF